MTRLPVSSMKPIDQVVTALKAAGQRAAKLQASIPVWTNTNGDGVTVSPPPSVTPTAKGNTP